LFLDLQICFRDWQWSTSYSSYLYVVQGLLFRGLDASLAKDIPGYVFYFVTYYNMVHSAPGLALGPLAPIIMGALAGMFSWSLVFPLDVCKT
jgi:hypothetical protein